MSMKWVLTSSSASGETHFFCRGFVHLFLMLICTTSRARCGGLRWAAAAVQLHPQEAAVVIQEAAVVISCISSVSLYPRDCISSLACQ